MRKESFESLVSRSSAVHANKYTYSRLSASPNGTLLHATCPTHGEFTQLAKTHLRGGGCYLCGREAVAVKKRTPFQVAVAKARKVHGERFQYLRVSFEEPDSKATIHYTCAQHGELQQSLNDHLGGHGCRACHYEEAKTSSRARYDYYLSKALRVHANTYTYLPHCETLPDRFSIVCPDHGEFQQRFVNHAGGEGCPKCATDRTGLLLRYNADAYRKDATAAHKNRYSYGGLLYEDSSRAKIEAFCSNHGKFVSSAKDHLRKLTNCPSCSTRISKGQQEVYDYLKPYCPDLDLEVRLDSSRKTWDIVSKSLGICVEYDGLIWHSSCYAKNATSVTKWRQAAAAGYRQINIYSDEWRDKKELVKSLLLQAFGASTSQRFFSRKLRVNQVLKPEAEEFLTLNHLQGFRKTSSYVGLYADRLVAVLGYELRASGRGRVKDCTQMEITRYATSARVLGGFSKLLSHVIKSHPSLAYCYTFSDNRLFSGQTYARCGFTEVADIPHSYCYTRGESRFNKANFQKSRLLKLAPRSDPTLSEKELAAQLGYYQLYDCGKVKWGKLLTK